MHAKANEYTIHEEGEQQGKEELPGQEAVGEARCIECENGEDDSFMYKCGDCVEVRCILCRSQYGCHQCDKTLCEHCNTRHTCSTSSGSSSSSSTLPPTASSSHWQPSTSLDDTTFASNPVEQRGTNDDHPTHTSERPQNESLGGEQTSTMPTTRRRTTLDDPEADFDIADEHFEVPWQEDQGIAPQEAQVDFEGTRASHGEQHPPLRRRLNAKTPPQLAHQDYQRVRKRPINFTEIEEDMQSTRKFIRANLEEIIAAASSHSSEKPVELTSSESAPEPPRIHLSHRRALVNSIQFCIKRGLYSIIIVEGLATQCKGRPSNNYGRAQLKKLLDGKHPVRCAVTWRDGSSALIRHKPRRLDIFS